MLSTVLSGKMSCISLINTLLVIGAHNGIMGKLLWLLASVLENSYGTMVT